MLFSDPMFHFGFKLLWRRMAVLMAAVLALNTAMPVALAAARSAERAQLRAMGLLDVVNCHAGVSDTAPAEHAPKRPAHHADCECCLTGCGAAGPVSLPDDRGALSRPLVAAAAAVRVASQAQALRSYLSERTRAPRSPPPTA